MVQRPAGTESPTSGLNAQRLEPRLINLAGSYWPIGGATVRLAPTIGRRGARANSAGVIGLEPARIIESFTRGSARPRREASCWFSPTSPLTVAHVTGTAPRTSADLPSSANEWPTPTPPNSSCASTSVSGIEGSVRTPPVERVAVTTRKVVPTGDGE